MILPVFEMPPLLLKINRPFGSLHWLSCQDEQGVINAQQAVYGLRLRRTALVTIGLRWGQLISVG